MQQVTPTQARSLANRFGEIANEMANTKRATSGSRETERRSALHNALAEPYLALCFAAETVFREYPEIRPDGFEGWTPWPMVHSNSTASAVSLLSEIFHFAVTPFDQVESAAVLTAADAARLATDAEAILAMIAQLKAFAHESLPPVTAAWAVTVCSAVEVDYVARSARLLRTVAPFLAEHIELLLRPAIPSAATNSEEGV